MNKKAVISQPMHGLSDQQILDTRKKAKDYLESKGYEVINTFFTDDMVDKDVLNNVKHKPVMYLGLSIQMMSLADVVYFAKGFSEHTGCILEHDVAEAYGLGLIYEDNEERISMIFDKEDDECNEGNLLECDSAIPDLTEAVRNLTMSVDGLTSVVTNKDLLMDLKK